MKQPDTAAVLAAHGARLLDQLAPKLTGFDANSAAMIGIMLQMAAEDWDGAAAMRVEENRAIRALLRKGAAALGEEPIAQRFAELAAAADDDLRLSALDRANDDLRAALAELHAMTEIREDRAQLNEAIWAELRRSTERRRVSLANF